MLKPAVSFVSLGYRSIDLQIDTSLVEHQPLVSVTFLKIPDSLFLARWPSYLMLPTPINLALKGVIDYLAEIIV